MKLSINADIDLASDDDEVGYVTWLDVRAYGDSGAAVLGSARMALVHVGEITDAQADLRAALERARLGGLHDTYFAQGWYRDEYADGAGIDLLFVERVAVEEPATNLDLAIVRRLADTIGSGCQLVVMPHRDAHEAARWSRIGFRASTPGRPVGLLHMKLGQQQTRLVAIGHSAFEIVGVEPDLAALSLAN